MDIYDLILTPIYLALFYTLAYWLRPKITNKATKKYFIPALTVKFIGAIGLGIVYQFYYTNGDTYNYYNQIKVLHKAYLDSPAIWLKLLLSNGEFNQDIYKYACQMIWYTSPSE